MAAMRSPPAPAHVITPVIFTLTNDCGLVHVTNGNDSGSGSLRQAINDVCDGGTISFADDYSIYLEDTLTIDKDSHD